METNSWIERVIIQSLSYPDKRYKHDYGGKEHSTESLIADCAHLKDITSGGPVLQLDKLPQQHEEIEDDVAEAAEALHDRGLLEKVGERPIQTELGGETIGMTSVWEPTDEGLAEAKRLNEAYSEAIADLLEQHDNPEDVSVDEVRPILKQYGVIPDRLPREFYESSDGDS